MLLRAWGYLTVVSLFLAAGRSTIDGPWWVAPLALGIAWIVTGSLEAS